MNCSSPAGLSRQCQTGDQYKARSPDVLFSRAQPPTAFARPTGFSKRFQTHLSQTSRNLNCAYPLLCLVRGHLGRAVNHDCQNSCLGDTCLPQRQRQLMKSCPISFAICRMAGTRSAKAACSVVIPNPGHFKVDDRGRPALRMFIQDLCWQLAYIFFHAHRRFALPGRAMPGRSCSPFLNDGFDMNPFSNLSLLTPDPTRKTTKLYPFSQIDRNFDQCQSFGVSIPFALML